MKTIDDRLQFEDSKRQFAKKLANDPIIQEKNKELFALADKYNFSYLWSWMGVPMIQAPADIMTLQEILWKTQPDILIETGVARGGSVIMAASMMALMGKGKVIGVDIEIRPHNKETILNSIVSDRITLIEGSSTDSTTLQAIKNELKGNPKVMVILDSNHSHQHVLDELRLYAPLVTQGHYLVVADTCIEDFPATNIREQRPWSRGNNPKTAMDAFLKESSRFQLDEFLNQKLLLTNSPNGYYICL